MPVPTIQRRPLAVGQSGFSEAAGTAERAQATLFSGISEAAAQLRTRLQPELNQQAKDQAAEDVVKAAEARENGTFVVETPRRMLLTQQDQVYNNTLEAGITAQAANDLSKAAARLETEFEFDPEGFENASKDFRDNYTGTAELGSELSLTIDMQAQQEFDQTSARITARKRAKDTAEKQQALEDRLSHLTGKMDSAIERIGQEGAFSLEYQYAQEEYLEVINTLIDNPAFGWSEERGAEALDGVANRMQELVGIGEMETVYLTPASKGGGTVAAMDFIDRTVLKMDLDQNERIGARSRMMQRLNWLQQKQSIEDAQKTANEKATNELGEKLARDFEADLLKRMAGGTEPTFPEIDVLGQMVTAGWMDPARMQVYVTAATATTPQKGDEINLASMYDYARTPGVTREDVERVTLQSMGPLRLSAADRERVIEAHTKHNDERVKPGQALLEGFFSTGFMDIDSAGVKSAKARAESDLQNWFAENPEATRGQVEQKARMLAVESGRRIPRPPMPSIPEFSQSRFVTIETVDEWATQARVAADDAHNAGALDMAGYIRANQQIDEQLAWQREQGRLMQESVSNAEPE